MECLPDMDVEACWADPEGDRAASDYAYAALLSVADLLIMWKDFSTDASTPEYDGRLAGSLQRRFLGRCFRSIVLWAQNSPLAPGELSAALQTISEAGPIAVWVTPVSLMAQEHQGVLAQA